MYYSKSQAVSERFFFFHDAQDNYDVLYYTFLIKLISDYFFSFDYKLFPMHKSNLYIDE